MITCDVCIAFTISLIIIFIVLIGYKSSQTILQFSLIALIFIGVFLTFLFFLYRINHYYITYKTFKLPSEHKMIYIEANKPIRRKYKKTK